jgi:hypothetical protein
MSPKFMFAVVVAALGLSAGQAFAESEGSGDPFPFRVVQQVAVGRSFVADTGSAAYPQSTVNASQPSSLARLEPVAGSEALVQTASSLPRDFENGSLADVQAQSLDRYLARRSDRKNHLEAGVLPPKS